MKPLPSDENNPLAKGIGDGDLIMWLAYKEAKAMLQFDADPAAQDARREMTASMYKLLRSLSTGLGPSL